MTDWIGSLRMSERSPRRVVLTMSRTTRIYGWLLALVGAVLALISSRTFRSGWGAATYFLGPVLAACAYVSWAFYLFVDRQQWVAVAAPLAALGVSFAATTAHAYRTEALLRRFIGRVLGRYATLDVMRQVNRDLSLMRPRRQPVTLFLGNVEEPSKTCGEVRRRLRTRFVGEEPG